MEFSEDHVKEAKEFGDFYIDIVDNFKSNIKYYLSDDVTLDWFGHTIKGERNVSEFFKLNVDRVKHSISNAIPVNKIGFRDSHVVKVTKECKKLPVTIPNHSANGDQAVTPPHQTQAPSTSSIAFLEKGQGDGFHNDCTLAMSPAKKFKPTPIEETIPHIESDTETIECESEHIESLKYITAEGFVQFTKPSFKKLQSETKWKRPCKLSVAYTSTNCNNKDYVIYLIIYEGNVKCKRNLLKDFEAEESEN